MKMKPVGGVLVLALAGPVVLANLLFSFPQSTQTKVHLRKFQIPGYPPLARQAWVQGKVEVTVHLRSDGTVDSVSDITGHPLLASRVADAVKSWEFEPPGHDSMVLVIEFEYVLKGPQDERNVVHQISGTLPTHCEVVTNPVPSTHY